MSSGGTPPVRRLIGRLREGLPDEAQRSLRAGAERWGLATAGLRMLPAFVVVGAQRCGTTTLYRLLCEHPEVARPTFSKGIGFFDLEYERGLRWYRGHFPMAAPARLRRSGVPVTFESSGYYCYHPLAPERMARDLPGVRAVMLVRDPVERAFSAWKHERARSFETESFERALELEPTRIAGEAERIACQPGYRSFEHRHHSYLARGRYVEQILRLQAALGVGNVRVVDADRFFADPTGEFTMLTDWLGLSRWEPGEVGKWNARPSDAMDPALRERLEREFEPWDAQLAELVGWEPSWRAVN